MAGKSREHAVRLFLFINLRSVFSFGAFFITVIIFLFLALLLQAADNHCNS